MYLPKKEKQPESKVTTPQLQDSSQYETLSGKNRSQIEPDNFENIESFDPKNMLRWMKQTNVDYDKLKNQNKDLDYNKHMVLSPNVTLIEKDMFGR